jgi:uncharacterized protein YjbI with pentapeptide repeats
MTKTINQKQLNKILHEHRRWVRGALTGTKADLRFANLAGADLVKADLTGANLSFANLAGANLTGSALPFANLKGANLTDADLSGIELREADLTLAKFDINFRNVQWFRNITISKDQLPWVVLNPRFYMFRDSIIIAENNNESRRSG